MTTIVFVRRFLADYARNPVNLLMLVVVPGLVVAGLPARRLVAARLAAGLALALLVSVVALVALQLRTGIDQPARVIVGTAMFAVIYLGIGATVGALVRNPVNGTVLILFVWILDIFFGPSMGVGTKPWTR